MDCLSGLFHSPLYLWGLSALLCIVVLFFVADSIQFINPLVDAILIP